MRGRHVPERAEVHMTLTEAGALARVLGDLRDDVLNRRVDFCLNEQEDEALESLVDALESALGQSGERAGVG